MCYKGLQHYCREQCVGSCTPMWSATPGTGDGIRKKFCNGHEDIDGCPFQPY